MKLMTTIKVNCGCGFTATEIEEGIKHAQKTGHSLTINGEIKSEKEKKTYERESDEAR